MNWQHLHADWTLPPRGKFPKRANILFGTDIELASSFTKFLLDAPALLPMLLVVTLLTIPVAIPNTLAGRALLDGITLLFARRTQLGRGGPTFRRGTGTVILSLRRVAERHGG